MVHIDTDKIPVTRLAVKLANLAADMDAAAYRSKAHAIASARLDGAAQVAHILGYGNTPTHVELDVLTWVRENPRPVDNSAFRTDAKAWTLKVSTELAGILQGIGYSVEDVLKSL